MTRTFCVGAASDAPRVGNDSPNARFDAALDAVEPARPARMSTRRPGEVYEDAGADLTDPETETGFIHPPATGSASKSTSPRGSRAAARSPATIDVRARALRPEVGGVRTRTSSSSPRTATRTQRRTRSSLRSDCTSHLARWPRPEPALTRVENGDRELAVQTTHRAALCTLHRFTATMVARLVISSLIPADPR